jgi:hypothetical protein
LEDSSIPDQSAIFSEWGPLTPTETITPSVQFNVTGNIEQSSVLTATAAVFPATSQSGETTVFGESPIPVPSLPPQQTSRFDLTGPRLHSAVAFAGRTAILSPSSEANPSLYSPYSALLVKFDASWGFDATPDLVPSTFAAASGAVQANSEVFVDSTAGPSIIPTDSVLFQESGVGQVSAPPNLTPQLDPSSQIDASSPPAFEESSTPISSVSFVDSVPSRESGVGQVSAPPDLTPR